ncbi:MAG: hypothetical protein WKF84_16330 [Pyrinomonadaceae bacterium]
MLVLLEAQEENWEDIDLMVRAFQNATMSLRYSAKACSGGAVSDERLAAAAKSVLHADRVRASAETYIGLVEVGVGLIPAGGGTKEMTLRALDSIPRGLRRSRPVSFLKRAFETIALAKVATSAEDARSMGLLAADDTISMNADRLIADAKQEVLALAASGYVEPQPRTDILALGENAAGHIQARHSSNEARWVYLGL